MSLTVSTKSYAIDRQYPDSHIYAGPATTLSSKDSIEAKRVLPKPTATDPGKAKPALRLVRTVTCADGVKRDQVLMISGSFSANIADADIVSMVTDAKELLLQEIAGTIKVFRAMKLSY